ncbi:hypothetical protein apy_00890 [Aeropyrum pernix]|uniref:Uncharacterized protein n=1 Tax=Aeropyrum pernix TaxID=56636 RepID=A0A401H7H6_AERPX|nr:hypothetical protein [Aeropyrum pernix]GBF08364.1 hypothetical protein apy_00890 [Aeropyrum pernix]
MKGKDIVLVEIKEWDQIRRYSIAAEEIRGRLIIVLNVLDGDKVSVWGFKQLGLPEEK